MTYKINSSMSDYLLRLSKQVEQKGKLSDEIILETVPMQHKFILASPDDDEFKFLYEINQSAKNLFKLTLFIMYDDEKMGLLRVDFVGQHLNPEGINEYLPERFHQYAGKFFKFDEHHIHYHVDGYKPMAWAIPILHDEFKVKSINNQNDVTNAFLEFNQLINLKTNFVTGNQSLI